MRTYQLSKSEVVSVLKSLQGEDRSISVSLKDAPLLWEMKPSVALKHFEEAPGVRYWTYVDRDGHLTISDCRLGGMDCDE